jgi:hypothetical protein
VAMEIDTLQHEYKGKEMMNSKEEQNDETDAEVDLKEELICALNKIKKLNKNNLKQKELQQKYKEEDCDAKKKCHKALKKQRRQLST